MGRQRLLITGADGMLGTELKRQAAERYELIPTDIGELDVADREQVRRVVGAERPDLILHGGALTNVDLCETEPDLAYRVNALGTRNMAGAAADRGVPILYVSTDYVFGGDQQRPYLEFDPVAPRSVYGRSKLAGEVAAAELSGGRFWIVRSQWIFGFGGKNFVDTILGAAREGRPLKVVDDQIGCPTWARDLAAALLLILDARPAYGIYHCSSKGSCSWFEFTRAILRAAGVEPASLQPIGSAELDRPAPRPAHSILRNYCLEQTLGDPMPDWQTALEAYLRAGGGSPNQE